MTGCGLVFLVVVCIHFVAEAGHAASQEEAARAAARVIQQQQEEREALSEEFRQRRTPAPEMPDPQLPEKDIQPDSDDCHPIDDIVVEGVTLLRADEIVRITDRFAGRCLGISDINTILREITIRYFDAGFITSRPYIKPQDLADRILEVTVVEGRIEGLAYGTREHKDDRSLDFAFPVREGKLLNLRDLEQGLDQLNRLQSNNATLKLLPGLEPGTSQIVLENEHADRLNLSLSLDNNGTESTGKYQGHVSLGYDNPFGLADYFGLTFSHDLHHDSGKDSRNVFARYEIPFGWSLFGISYSHFDYLQPVEGGSQVFPATGTTRNLSLSAGRVLYRDRQSKFSVGLVLDWKDEKNYLLDVLLDTSSQHFIVGRASIRMERYFRRATLALAVNYHRGLDIIDAQDDSDGAPGLPQAQFEKTTADISVKSAFGPVNHEILLHGQIGNDRLFASEQVSIGSLYTVRGFREEGYSGGSGGYVRYDLLFLLPAGETLRKLDIATLEPFLGVDWGSVEVVDGSASSYENLQSWTVGIKGWDARQSLRIGYSRPINAPVGFDASDGEFAFSYTRYF